MPTLVKGGPDIPAPVLQALEDGELVLFCGAGISKPMLPNFSELVTKLYAAVGEKATPEERSAIETGQLDRSLGLLEKRLTPGELRRQVHRMLTLPDLSNLPLHKSILELAKTSEGDIRLVTTNFDNGFKLAGCTEEDTDSAPKLPVPKPSSWRSLVHLHGRIYPGRPERDDLILTSAWYRSSTTIRGKATSSCEKH